MDVLFAQNREHIEMVRREAKQRDRRDMELLFKQCSGMLQEYLENSGIVMTSCLLSISGAVQYTSSGCS